MIQPPLLSRLRMLLANQLISWALDMMPADHPATSIWARHIMSASLEAWAEQAKSNPKIIDRIRQETTT